VWKIDFTVDGCAGERHCSIVRGQTRTVYLRLAFTGNTYEGVADMAYHVPVTGTLDANGVLTLSGHRPTPGGVSTGYEVTIDGITMSRSGWNGEVISGRVQYTTRGPSNSSFFGTSVVHGPIASAERVGGLDGPTALSGTWSAELPVTTCEYLGWPRCFPFHVDEIQRMTLVLEQGLNGLAGTLKVGGTTIPVGGTGNGSSMQLVGSASPASSGVNVTYTIETASLATDRVGRLNGSLSLTATYDWHDGRGTWVVKYPALPIEFGARSLRVSQ
jgi:hypothetical protein